MKNALLDESPKHVVIVGAGFIGLEVSEACRHYGKHVTVVELADHILPAFDTEVSQALKEELEKNGVAVKTGTKVTELIAEGGKIVKARLEGKNESGEAVVEEIFADLVISSHQLPLLLKTWRRRKTERSASMNGWRPVWRMCMQQETAALCGQPLPDFIRMLP